MLKEIQLAGKTWQFAGDELIWEDTSTGFKKRITIHHPSFQSLQGLAIREIIPTPAQDGLLLLLEPAPPGYRTVGNLVCVNLEGEVEWWAELTDTGTDNYTAFRVNNEGITAYSWNGFSCQIDPRTGKIVKGEWVK